MFFYVGGYVHLQAWHRARDRGEHLGHFVRRNLRRLSLPAIVLAAVWIGLGVALWAAFGLEWIGRAVLLVISPLWFIGVYLVLIALIPLWFALCRRFGPVAYVWMVGLVVIVDILRFRAGYEHLAYVNMLLVWGLAFTAGFSYEALVRAPRQIDAALMWAGLFGLVGLVGSGLYPGSMVGVPGETSNMAPPTLCIVALLAFQMGVAEMARPPSSGGWSGRGRAAPSRSSPASRCRCSCSTPPGWRSAAASSTRGTASSPRRRCRTCDGGWSARSTSRCRSPARSR